jgi:hypothetical protein
VDAQGALHTTYQRKVNGLAGSLVNRRPAALGLQPPKLLSTNIVVPSIAAGSVGMCFLPDQLLISPRQAVPRPPLPGSDLHGQHDPLHRIGPGTP